MTGFCCFFKDAPTEAIFEDGDAVNEWGGIALPWDLDVGELDASRAGVLIRSGVVLHCGVGIDVGAFESGEFSAERDDFVASVSQQRRERDNSDA